MNSYMFWASLARHPEEHCCTKQSLDLFVISSMWNCRKFINVWFI